MMKIGLIALVAVAAASPALAATTENPFARDHAILDLRGLDLATPSGQQSLAIRTDSAARAVCGEELASVHLALEAKAQACRTAVAADIRAQIETRMAKADTAASAHLALAR